MCFQFEGYHGHSAVGKQKLPDEIRRIDREIAGNITSNGGLNQGDAQNYFDNNTWQLVVAK